MRYVGRYLPKGRGRLLDAGAGAGIYESLVTSKGYDYFGIDVKPRGARVRYGDVTDIPFHDDYFDATICVDVIEEVKNDLRALKEIRRVLKPRGVLVLHTPNKNQTHILVKPEDNPNHVRRGYSSSELRELFHKARFSSASTHSTFDILECIAWELNYISSHRIPLDFSKLLNFHQSKYVPLGLLVVTHK